MSKKIYVAVGLAVVILVLILVYLNSGVDIKKLELDVMHSVQEVYNAKTIGPRQVLSITLTKDAKNIYIGSILVCDYGRESWKRIDVYYDGEDFYWEILP